MSARFNGMSGLHMTPPMRKEIMVGSIAAAVVQLTTLMLVLHFDASTGRTLIAAVGTLAITTGWPVATLWLTGSAPKGAKFRGVMRALTGIFAGVAALCGTGGSSRWMWFSLVGASLTAILSFVPTQRIKT